MTQVHSKSAEASINRLLWREQIRALPGALRAAARRLLRREPRWYLTVDGHVVARLVSRKDYDILMQWIATVHTETFDFGLDYGRRLQQRDADRQTADAGDPGTS